MAARSNQGIWSVVCERLAQLAWTTCIIPQVPWPRGYATVTAPSWVTAPSPKKEPSIEKEKAYIRVATVSN